MSRKKPSVRPNTTGTPGDNAVSVNAEIVINPLTGTPAVSRTSGYRAEYCGLILKMFSEMLDASGTKLEEAVIEETRSLAEKQPVAAEESADGKKHRARPQIAITEKRTVKRKEWRMVCAELPSLSKFARMVGVSAQTVNNWRALHPAFENACAMAIDMAGDALFQRGLRGQYDAEMVKFVGKNWFGFADRHEVTGADGAPLNPPAELRLLPESQLAQIEQELRAIKQRLIGQGEPTA